MKRQIPARAAIAADAPAMLALDRETPNAAHWTESQYQNLFSGGTRAGIVIDDGNLRAFAVARDLGPEWEIENLVVSPSCRRCGFGTHMLAALLEFARQHGAQSVFLEVRESNAAARALYAKSGFAAFGRRPSYYQNPNEDAIVYKFSFCPAAPESC